jgi:hypothetical protein
MPKAVQQHRTPKRRRLRERFSEEPEHWMWGVGCSSDACLLHFPLSPRGDPA